MSEGEIIDCNKNEKHKTVIILLFFTFAIDSKIKKLLQIKARNNDGEKPANQTNNKIEKGFAKKTKLYFFIFFPIMTAIPENKDKCIPDNAKMCDNPEFLNAFCTSIGIYSLEPQIKARNNPPALPHENNILFNSRRHNALK